MHSYQNVARTSFLKRKVKIARALLYKMYRTYPVTNAFWTVDFGDNAFGVYRATVDEAMHFDVHPNMLVSSSLATSYFTPGRGKR